MCELQGTWRWHPDKDFKEVRQELEALVRRVPLEDNIDVKSSWTFVGESFAIDSEEPIVQSLRSAYRELEGTELELAGISSIIDTSRLVPAGGVPTVPLDFHGESAHSDYELVELARVDEGCKLALLTVLNYFERGSG
jgi:acetylornithine deacetylase/succinyl-diaminopimelate desuccinylase-like protein